MSEKVLKHLFGNDPQTDKSVPAFEAEILFKEKRKERRFSFPVKCTVPNPEHR